MITNDKTIFRILYETSAKALIEGSCRGLILLLYSVKEIKIFSEYKLN